MNEKDIASHMAKSLEEFIAMTTKQGFGVVSKQPYQDEPTRLTAAAIENAVKAARIGQRDQLKIEYTHEPRPDWMPLTRSRFIEVAIPSYWDYAPNLIDMMLLIEIAAVVGISDWECFVYASFCEQHKIPLEIFFARLWNGTSVETIITTLTGIWGKEV